jgi:hypothetical protein
MNHLLALADTLSVLFFLCHTRKRLQPITIVIKAKMVLFIFEVFDRTGLALAVGFATPTLRANQIGRAELILMIARFSLLVVRMSFAAAFVAGKTLFADWAVFKVADSSSTCLFGTDAACCAF